MDKKNQTLLLSLFYICDSAELVQVDSESGPLILDQEASDLIQIPKSLNHDQDPLFLHFCI